MNIQPDGSVVLSKEDAEALASYFKKTIFLEPINEQDENIKKFFRTLNVIDGELAGTTTVPYTHIQYLKAQTMRLSYQMEYYRLKEELEQKEYEIKNFPTKNIEYEYKQYAMGTAGSFDVSGMYNIANGANGTFTASKPMNKVEAPTKSLRNLFGIIK